MVPDLDLADFKAVAWFDYVKFRSLVHGAHLSGSLSKKAKTPAKPDASGHYTLTLHDPTRDDLSFLITDLDDPQLAAVEIYIDFYLKDAHAPDRRLRLERCFQALAARLRVDDRHPTGAGFKSAQSEHGNSPLNVRLPRVGETMVIGHRDTGVNFKVYLKRKDDNRPLPDAEWRVRMEITISHDGLGRFSLRRISSLKNYKYRRAFARLFQVVDRVSVRERSDWSDALRRRAEARLRRHWSRVGVHSISPRRMPEDALEATVLAANYRTKPGPHQVLPPRHYKFHRHLGAHDLVADALRKMDRVLGSERFPGTPPGCDRADSQC